MLNQAISSHSPDPAPARPLRWIALLGASVLLHWIVLSMASDGFGSMAPTRMTPAPVMTATLRAAPAVPPEAPPAAVAAAEIAPAPTPPKPVPAKRPARPKPATVASVARPPTADTDAPAAPGPTPEIATASPPDPTPPVAAGAPSDVADAAATQQAARQAAVPQTGDAQNLDRAPRYTVSLPPPVTLEYEVRYATRGNITRGSSKIDWQPGEGGYAIRGEVTKFGFALSSFRSEGAIDDAGIAPTLYAEKNARRSETNTHFQRRAGPIISFSAATDTFPLLTGAQDRASILWQLSGIARGDRQAFVPGAVLDVFVAGVRDAEHWLIKIIGEEAVTLDTGEARAWHLVRTPRAGSYDKRIDIWLAPEQQWYPVKLRYTEVNGDYLDLSLSALHQPGAR